MKRQILILCLTLVAGTIAAQGGKHSKNTLYPSYKGLIMAGYQGWFRAPADGIMYPDETKVRIDMWPDVSEYEITYPTGLKLA
ncbi:MAG: xylosidase, partial [Tannerellaceae bacterium]|nr:xylosidase [Tannerellaceae bacterium]